MFGIKDSGESISPALSWSRRQLLVLTPYTLGLVREMKYFGAHEGHLSVVTTEANPATRKSTESTAAIWRTATFVFRVTCGNNSNRGTT